MSKVELMGILNLTADSFSGDGISSLQLALNQARAMVADGAKLIDVGAESTRPGATLINEQQEWSRLQPILSGLNQAYEGQLSLDSYHPQTIRQALKSFKLIINDVTGFNNRQMIELAAEFDASCIVSHLPRVLGQDIQAAHQPENKIDSVEQVRSELLDIRQQLIDAGVKSDKIILDPGIGFGKTIELNWALLEFPRLVPEYPVLIGYSKKSFLGDDRMTVERNLEAGELAIGAGAKYLRLHADLLAAHFQRFVSQA